MSVEQRPAPLTPADCDLQDFPYVLVDVRAVLNRKIELRPREFMAGFMLMVESWHQVPAASIPNDPRELARLSTAGRNWWRVRDKALEEFILCSDGRYYHPPLAARAARAWETKQRLRRREIRRLEMESGVWAAMRSATFARDQYKCRYCGATRVRLEADHVVPVVLGGESTLENLVTACQTCNRSKGAKRLEDWKP